MLKPILLAIGIIISVSAVQGAEKFEAVKLGPPQMEGGKPLMQCLKERKSLRAFADRQVPRQELSNLLWAAFGINRPEENKRTAPSAMNRQEMDIYVMLKTGVYLYDPNDNSLLPVSPGDHRKLAGLQEFSWTAPLTLFLVSDRARLKGGKKEQERFSGLNAGYISQNVYLYCASAGLATVARASIDKQALSAVIKLRPGQEIILAQSVGYPLGMINKK